jgi:hypothetical protein
MSTVCFGNPWTWSIPAGLHMTPHVSSAQLVLKSRQRVNMTPLPLRYVCMSCWFHVAWEVLCTCAMFEFSRILKFRWLPWPNGSALFDCRCFELNRCPHIAHSWTRYRTCNQGSSSFLPFPSLSLLFPLVVFVHLYPPLCLCCTRCYISHAGYQPMYTHQFTEVPPFYQQAPAPTGMSSVHGQFSRLHVCIHECVF